MDGMDMDEMEVEMDESVLPEVRSSVALCGFLELVIHQLLYVKNIYPKIVFKEVKRKGVATWICIHPGVRQYILNFLDFANGFLMQEKKFRIIFVLKRRSEEILEQFVFELKVNELDVGSPDKMINIVDNLIPICEDIQKKNKVVYENHLNMGDQEITFELQIRIKPPSVIPKISPNYPWVVCVNQEVENLEEFNKIREEENNLYEIAAYSKNVKEVEK